MRVTKANPMRPVHVGLARLQQSIGWAGIAGVALLVAAALVTALAWSAQQAFENTVPARTADVAVARPASPASATPTALPQPSLELPAASEIPLLLTQMKQAAVGNGLDWRAAEYRVTPATPTQPASLEVRCSLKGPYPKLRSLLVQLKSAIPAFAIREFSASRPNADTPDIEAKLVMAVFLQDGAPASEASASAPATKETP